MGEPGSARASDASDGGRAKAHTAAASHSPCLTYAHVAASAPSSASRPGRTGRRSTSATNSAARRAAGALAAGRPASPLRQRELQPLPVPARALPDLSPAFFWISWEGGRPFRMPLWHSLDSKADELAHFPSLLVAYTWSNLAAPILDATQPIEMEFTVPYGRVEVFEPLGGDVLISWLPSDENSPSWPGVTNEAATVRDFPTAVFWKNEGRIGSRVGARPALGVNAAVSALAAAVSRHGQRRRGRAAQVRLQTAHGGRELRRRQVRGAPR